MQHSYLTKGYKYIQYNAQMLTEEYPVKLIRLGIKDTFGKSGKAEKLMEYFGITAENIERQF